MLQIFADISDRNTRPNTKKKDMEGTAPFVRHRLRRITRYATASIPVIANTAANPGALFFAVPAVVPSAAGAAAFAAAGLALVGADVHALARRRCHRRCRGGGHAGISVAKSVGAWRCGVGGVFLAVPVGDYDSDSGVVHISHQLGIFTTVIRFLQSPSSTVQFSR